MTRIEPHVTLNARTMFHTRTHDTIMLNNAHDIDNDIIDDEAADDAMWALYLQECDAEDEAEHIEWLYAEERVDDDDAFDWGSYDDAAEFN